MAVGDLATQWANPSAATAQTLFSRNIPGSEPEVFICRCIIAGIQGTNVVLEHCNDVIMGAIVSQITSLTIVYSTVYSGADQRKHESSASLAFVRGIHRGPVNSPHKWPVTRKMFPFDDIIMDTLLGWFICFMVISTAKVTLSLTLQWRQMSVKASDFTGSCFFAQKLLQINKASQYGPRVCHYVTPRTNGQ